VAVGLVPVLLEGAFVELFEAEGANEVLRVEFSEHGGYAAAGYGFSALRARRAAHLVVVVFAVWETFVLEKVTFRKRLLALPANEARGMPRPIEGGDVIFSDWELAPTTLGCKRRVETVGAKCLALLFVVSVVSEGSLAILTDKMLRVPSLVQSRDALVQDGSVTGGATR